MNGRGGVLTVMLGLFLYGIVFGLHVLFWCFVGALWVLLGVGKLIGIAWRAHKRRKLAQAEQEELRNPPRPFMSPVGGPRDWSQRD